MGIEILETGQVQVYRPDRDWLRAVRSGLYSYDELLEKAAGDRARLKSAWAVSALPDEPDAEPVEALVVDLQERFLWETRPGA